MEIIEPLNDSPFDINHFPVLWGTYLAGKMPAPQEFYDSTLYLIFSGKRCVSSFFHERGFLNASLGCTIKIVLASQRSFKVSQCHQATEQNSTIIVEKPF